MGVVCLFVARQPRPCQGEERRDGKLLAGCQKSAGQAVDVARESRQKK